MNNRKNPTIKDIARLANVSTTTVSHVLNSTRHVSDDLTARVQVVIRDLEYKPNAMARALRVHSSKTLGLIIPDNSNPFFSEIAERFPVTLHQQVGADLGERLLLGNAFVGEDCIGKDTDASGTDILCQQRVLLGTFNVFTKLLGVGPMIGKRAGQAQLDPDILELLPHVAPLDLR